MTRRGCMRVEISFVGCLGATRGCHLVLPRVGPLRAVGGCKTFETRYLSGFKKIKSTFTCNLDAAAEVAEAVFWDICGAKIDLPTNWMPGPADPRRRR